MSTEPETEISIEDDVNYATVAVPAGAGVVWPLDKEIPEGWSKNRMYGERNGFCFIMSDPPVEIDDEVSEDVIDHITSIDLYAAFIRWLDSEGEVKEWGSDDSAEVIAERYIESLDTGE